MKPNKTPLETFSSGLGTAPITKPIKTLLYRLANKKTSLLLIPKRADTPIIQKIPRTKPVKVDK